MLKVPSEVELPKGSSLQKYLDVTGQTLADLKPETQAMIERLGESLDDIPWGVVLIDHRPPTEGEIARARELFPEEFISELKRQV